MRRKGYHQAKNTKPQRSPMPRNFSMGHRYLEVKAEGTDSFALESLLPGTGYDVHVSKLKVKDHGPVQTGSY
jgi:hypothetical protein